MSDIIRLLPDHVANQIAAGEVVQRPASVVKELLENAIDAGATQISLIIKDAGKTLVQVIDDGKGMSMTDARMAFERHATSKITNANDLFDLHTKGFRGEALASVAAIAHVSLKTKREDDDLGTILEIEGSKVVNQEPVVTTKGTMISVRNLFYNVPARRKFLKSDNVELRNITDEFHRVAMAHPQVGLKFSSNDTELFNLPISNYRQRIVNIMGAKTNEKLVPVEEETELVKISGFVGKPEFARKTKGLQYFFVNDRFIKHNYLHHAVTSAFEGLLKEKNNPTYFLFLDVPKDSVDINIHPTKTEVKFDDEHSLYAIVRASVKHALGQFSINAIDFDKEPQYEVPYEYTKKNTSSPKIEVNPDFNPFSNTGSSSSSTSKSTPSYSKPAPQAWESLYAGLDDSSTLLDETEEVSMTTSMFEEEKVTRNIFQLQRKFIISTLKSGMLVIHQNRAHERVLYEQLLKHITVQRGTSQQLLFPLRLNLPVDEVSILTQLQEQLEQTGFIFKTLANNVVEIVGLPIQLKEKHVPEVLETIIRDSELDLPKESFSQSDRLAATMARGMAIRSGESMSQEAMENLVDELFACKESELTAQGKKVFINITGESLNLKFN
ncbi:DNA mismatch repair endonuclease MutL [Nonlabens ulvanivorans]|uniref:DNA mismatch repair protein MutL n=1 Tax=Nonlabens ulvanivorans TaxID=906888 RepID=A0A090X381_NONUL|nr:DNA mismatch repair endonuclease MutL [Nonlabens ulvanivorans]WOI24089.1 DNA mismatch repair endonuclease MutL [Nonlabens ulvanivorans]GAL75572.1 DNA mismatch repair protein mutL [Nonlabens ulvanivorans]